MKALRKAFRGDLSGPVLAVIITLVIIAVGAIVSYYFFFMGPNVAKTGSLTVIGQPALTYDSTNQVLTLYISVENPGTAPVNITKVVVTIGGAPYELLPVGTSGYVLQPGEQAALEFTATNVSVSLTEASYPIVIFTDAGTYETSAYNVAFVQG